MMVGPPRGLGLSSKAIAITAEEAGASSPGNVGKKETRFQESISFERRRSCVHRGCFACAKSSRKVLAQVEKQRCVSENR